MSAQLESDLVSIPYFAGGGKYILYRDKSLDYQVTVYFGYDMPGYTR